MKVTSHCAHCLLERAINQVKLATNDYGLQMEVVTAMLKFLGESFTRDAIPSHIGTDRDLLVQRMTGKDPYKDLKHQSNQMALAILPELQKLVEETSASQDRFRRAALIAAAANAIEFDVAGREFNLDELRTILDNIENDLAIDEVDEFRELCLTVNEVLYLMDNAGEIVLDIILISEIKRLGPRVVAVVKSGPILNDATIVDAEEVNLADFADEVIDTGAPAIGVNLERNSKEFKDRLFASQLIVAKGMGNFEALTEFEPFCPIVYILRTKCIPVSQHVGCPRHKNVVMIRRPS